MLTNSFHQSVADASICTKSYWDAQPFHLQARSVRTNTTLRSILLYRKSAHSLATSTVGLACLSGVIQYARTSVHYVDCKSMVCSHIGVPYIRTDQDRTLLSVNVLKCFSDLIPIHCHVQVVVKVSIRHSSTLSTAIWLM